MHTAPHKEPLTLGGLSALALLVWLLCLPGSMEAWFDGLPWSHRAELWVAAGALPLLIMLDRTFLNQRLPYLGITLLLVAKLLMSLSAPAGGWEIRVYAGDQALAQGRWERTYASLWRPGISELLDAPWGHPREFPVEWLNQDSPPPPGGYRLALEFRGAARVPEGAGLAVVAAGLEGGSARAWDAAGREVGLPLVGDMGRAAALAPGELAQGALRVEGRLRYGPGNWSLLPVLIWPDGRVEPAFKQGVLWRAAAGLELPAENLRVWLVLAKVIDYGLLLWLAGWAAWALGALWRRGILDAPLAVLLALVVGLPHLLLRFVRDPVHLLPLGLALALAGAGLALDARLRPRAWEPRGQSLGLTLLAVLGPGTLAWFLWLHGPAAGAMTFYSQGDDWLTYQVLARHIFLNGDWFDAAHGVWYSQPLYRYAVGLLHAFFGQSPAAQNMLDVWSALGSAALLAALAGRLGAGAGLALAAVWLYLLPEFLGPFRFHIGRGLQEHLAMLFMMLAAVAVPRWAGLGLAGAALAGLVAALGYWVRQDHLGVLAGLGVLCVPPVAGGLLEAWRGWLAALWARRGWLAVYLGALALAVLAVAARNWWFGGVFTLNDPNNLRFLTGMSAKGVALNFYMLFMATETEPSWVAWVLLPGTLLGLAALVWRGWGLQGHPLGLGVCLAGVLAPYFYGRINAYPPRFSLHLLPLAALSLAWGLGLLLGRWRDWRAARAGVRAERPRSSAP